MKTKLFLPIILGIFLLAFVSASPLSEFLSDNVTQLNVTITQNTSEVQFYLNTSGTSFDIQDIKYNYLEIKNIPISTILSEINFRAEYNNGIPELAYFHIEENSLTQVIIDNILAYFNYDYDVQDINNNFSILNGFLKETEDFGNGYFEKQGNDYTLFYDRGYGDIPENYKGEIAKVIDTAFTMNLKFINDYLVPYDEYLEILPFELNFDFDVSADLSELEFENGDYDISTNIDGIEKIIHLKLEGIDFEKSEYIPNSETIEKIYGLKAGTSINFEVVSGSQYNLPEALKSHGFFNISASQETGGKISFRLLKSEIENKNNVALYVLEDSLFGLSWDELPTSLINESGNYYTYESQTPHFSIFMVGETISPPSKRSGGSSSHKKETQEPSYVCMIGEKMCSGNFVSSCAGYNWVNIENCPYGCSGSKCKEKPQELIPDETKRNRITGGFLGFIENGGGVIVLSFLLLLILVIIIVFIVKNKKIKSGKNE